MSEREERLRRLFKGTHYISQEMDIRELTRDYIGPRNRIFLKADDEQIIFNYRGRREATLFLFGGGGLLWITLPFIFGDPPTQLETIGFIIIFILFSVLPCLWVLPRSYKVYTFDRMTGMMTFPNPRTLKNYGRDPGTITFPFSEARFGMFLMQAGRPRRLVISHPDGLHSYGIDFVPFFDAPQTHSILVWYMDKNRPLPPGELFDPYREKDYERRKAEGFQPPFYPASIDTPENTPEREKERIKREKKYWQQVEQELETFKREEPEAFEAFTNDLGKIQPNFLTERLTKLFKMQR